MKALVLATESSLPQFKNTPQSFSLARVLITLFTTLTLYRPSSLASLNGISRSIVSPDYEIDRNPDVEGFKGARSSLVISDAILASTNEKIPSSLIRNSAYYPA